MISKICFDGVNTKKLNPTEVDYLFISIPRELSTFPLTESMYSVLFNSMIGRFEPYGKATPFFHRILTT